MPGGILDSMSSDGASVVDGTALLANTRISRDEGGIEGAFRENCAEMVRQAQRDKKGVGNRPGPEDCGQNNVANEAGDTREERKTADG